MVWFNSWNSTITEWVNIHEVSLEIKSFSFRYFKDPILCVKCTLDGVPTEEKPSDEQTNAILEILGRLI